MGNWAAGLLYSIIVFFLFLPFWMICGRGKPSLSDTNRRKITSRVKKMKEIIHKGGLPENTIQGIRQSLDKGATAIEVDVQFTSCGTPVLLHDETVDRTTNGTGDISSMSMDHLKTLKIKSDRYPHPTVPPLRDLLNLLEERGDSTLLIIDLKLCGLKYMNVLVALLQLYPSLRDNIFICSFYPHLLYKLRMLEPNLLVGFLSYAPIYSAETYTGLTDDYRLTWFEKKFFNFMLWSAPKIIGTNLILVYKEDLYHRSFNIDELKANDYQVVLYEVGSTQEFNMCMSKYKLPLIISETFFNERKYKL